jgi:V/A-type H+/Na+-transporting ATPase subunit I
MFRAQPLSRMTLWCLTSEAPDMAVLLARQGIYNPSPVPQAELPEMAGQDYRETYVEARSRLDKILPFCGSTTTLAATADASAPTLAELRTLNTELGEIWRCCSEYQQRDSELQQQQRQLTALEETYGRLKNLHQGIGALLKSASLLQARIGQVPASNVHRLQEALELTGTLLLPFDRANEYTFALIAGMQGKQALGSLLAQAGWRDLAIPSELQTEPVAAETYLQTEKLRLSETAAAQSETKQKTVTRYLEPIATAQSRLNLARPMAESALAAARDQGALTAFTGWLPNRALPAVQAALDEQFPHRYVFSVRPPAPDEPAPVPSLLIYPGWLKPYIPLVRSYGVPRYGEFDPALLFASSYLILFGAMFGDIGHGTVLMGLSFMLRGQIAWLRPVGLLAGFSACAFGVLYGSVFGFEGVVHPVWMSPMHNPTRMLEVAILSGIGFITVTFVISIYNRISSGKLATALFDSRGLAGLLFFCGAVLGLAGLLQGHDFGFWNGAASVCGLSLIASLKWTNNSAALPERLLVTVIETLDSAINLFANTLSFLRVAAFSLNHVALALAVFALARNLGTPGHWFTVVAGNVVIIVLEGGVVAIQSLRLMYYEGFSRFFSGDGVEFKPLRIDVAPATSQPKSRFAFKSS